MRALVAAILLLAPQIGAIPVALAEPEAERATVQALDDSLIGIMKAGGTTKSRAQTIAPAIDRAFDLPLMTRLVVGPEWNTIAPPDQAALLAAFRRLTIAQYADNFDHWAGERFAIAPQVDVRGSDRLVRTTLSVPGKEPIAISYRLRESGGRWKIIDIFYHNAISQVALRRSDFAAVLAKGGARALAAHLDTLAAKGSF